MPQSMDRPQLDDDGTVGARVTLDRVRILGLEPDRTAETGERIRRSETVVAGSWCRRLIEGAVLHLRRARHGTVGAAVVGQVVRPDPLVGRRSAGRVYDQSVGRSLE